MKDKLNILVCENFAREVSAAVKMEKFDDVRVMPFSARCGRPGIGWDEIKTALGGENDCSHVCLIGSCCISAISNHPEIFKYCRLHRLEQCFYLVANRNICDSYLSKGAYLMTPAWARSWRDRIAAWGFDKKTACDFFHESARQVVLLDTGIDPECSRHLDEFSEFIGLPSENVSVGLDYLRLFLAKQVYEWRLWHVQKESHAVLKESEMKKANYAMALDLLSSVARQNSVSDVLGQIVDIFHMLFAPEYLYYRPYKNGKFGEHWPIVPDAGSPGDLDILKLMNNLDDPFSWTPSGNGFLLRVDSKGETIGVLVVETLEFPKYKEHYLNLSIDIINVCVLSFDNVNQYERLKNTEESLRQEKNKLQAALSEIKKLSGLLPICSYCNKVRDDRDIWHRIETYIREHSEAQFSHGICPNCMEELFPELMENGDFKTDK